DGGSIGCSARGQQATSPLGQSRAEMVAQQGDLLPNLHPPHGGEKPYRGLEAEDACVVRQAPLELLRGGPEGEVIVQETVGARRHAKVAAGGRPELRLERLSDVEESNAHGSEQPLVGARGQKVDLATADVELDRAQGLNRIDTEIDAAGAAKRAEPFEVDP